MYEAVHTGMTVFKLCKLTIVNLVEEKRKKQLSIANKQKMCKLAKKAKNLKLKKCSSQNTQDNS